MKITKACVLNSIASFLAVILISGCGGSGGSGSTLIPLGTSDIRTYKQGDNLTANITLRDTATGNTATGTITITVGAIVTNPFGIDCRSVTYAGTLTGPGGTIAYNVRSLFYQDMSNSLYECGEFNDTLGRYVFLTDTATTPNGIFMGSKSPVQIGDSTSAVLFYDDGTWDDCTRTVLAIENVSVPLGYYESYNVSEACSYSDGTVLNATVWVVPSIFNIKESGVVDGISAEVSVISYSFN